jgi:hypothetical protein
LQAEAHLLVWIEVLVEAAIVYYVLLLGYLAHHRHNSFFQVGEDVSNWRVVMPGSYRLRKASYGLSS